ncbi:MAG: UDP-glucose/GDP-mannose dehydrogenase family protein [Geminicoccaceae bacterium]|nr:UDP-glucose/GDP-mannose dehydrogenase family protein [Geminicoccaceae bacterium]MDW8342149.1 UDP-glucose/GDP-mannose dehydrogenase family protein [Geminicoccaceae bacterium]
MRIAMIGTGYVGLVSGACFAEFGVEVTCVDKAAEKIAMLEQGRIPIYEPGLEDLVARHRAAGRLRFSTELAPAIDGADAVFIAVGTPSRRGDGHADLSYVFAAAEEIARNLRHPALVVTKSTVPVGTGRRLARLFRRLRPDLAIDVASNPEFLREGSAIEDFMRPDRVICGVETEEARATLAALYRPLNLIETPILFTTIETAELIKYATNCFLAMKITFINELADLCEVVGADVQQVARGIGLDGRIGRKFLHAGPGYGGSCFPKDTVALLRTAEAHGVALRLIDTVVQVNEARKRRMVKKIVDAMGGEVAGRRIAVLGVTFKPNTDDMRESPSLVIVPALQAEGAEIRVFDPEGRREGEKLLPGVVWCGDPYEALTGADAVVVLTEWNVFRGLDLERARALVRRPVLVDLRNVFDPERAIRAGFAYTGVGRGAVSAHRPEPRAATGDER